MESNLNEMQGILCAHTEKNAIPFFLTLPCLVIRFVFFSFLYWHSVACNRIANKFSN